MYWRLSESFKARLWNERRSVKELEASLIETQKRAVQVKQARAGVPTNTGAFADRVATMRDAHGPIAATAGRAHRKAEPLSCRLSRSMELGRQKQRIETYQVQARFELAAIYDKAANEAKPKAHPRHAACDKPK